MLVKLACQFVRLVKVYSKVTKGLVSVLFVNSAHDTSEDSVKCDFRIFLVAQTS